MTKCLKALFMVAATLIMGMCLLFVPEQSGAVSVTYIAVLGLYLGLDVAGMITKTASMPKGEFKTLNKHKYIVTSVCLAVLIILCIYMKSKADVSTAMTSFLSSAMIVIACLIGGLEGNNIATDTTITGDEK